MRTPNAAAAEEKLRYEKLLKSVLPDYGQNDIGNVTLSNITNDVKFL